MNERDPEPGIRNRDILNSWGHLAGGVAANDRQVRQRRPRPPTTANDRQRPPRPPRPPTSNGSREPEPLAVLAVQQRKGLFANDLRELLVRQPLGGLGGPRFV